MPLTPKALARTLSDGANQQSWFELAPAALMLTTTDGTICAANPASMELLRRAGRHLEGSRLQGLIPIDARPTFRQQLDRVVQSRGETRWAFTVDRLDGRPIRIMATVKPMSASASGATSLYWCLSADLGATLP